MLIKKTNHPEDRDPSNVYMCKTSRSTSVAESSAQKPFPSSETPEDFSSPLRPVTPATKPERGWMPSAKRLSQLSRSRRPRLQASERSLPNIGDPPILNWHSTAAGATVDADRHSLPMGPQSDAFQEREMDRERRERESGIGRERENSNSERRGNRQRQLLWLQANTLETRIVRPIRTRSPDETMAGLHGLTD